MTRRELKAEILRLTRKMQSVELKLEKMRAWLENIESTTNIHYIEKRFEYLRLCRVAEAYQNAIVQTRLELDLMKDENTQY